VESLSLISGKAEFLLSVNGRNMREISNFVAHKLAPTDGVNGTETMFVLKEYKKNGISFEDDREDGERLLVTP
jgi:DNA-binding Lrp family transcriptional regulator